MTLLRYFGCLSGAIECVLFSHCKDITSTGLGCKEIIVVVMHWHKQIQTHIMAGEPIGGPLQLAPAELTGGTPETADAAS